MAIVPVDTTTIQPNGKRGDPAKTAFEKLNESIDTLAQGGSDVSGAIVAEASARAAADTALGLRIDGSATAVALGNEVTARTAADTALGLRIDDEATARAAADSALSTSIAAALLKTGKNKLINGMFQVWQRNNIFAAAVQTIYTADRWKLVAIGSTGAVTRDDYLLTDLAAPGRYICRVTSATNNAAGSAVNIQQAIEDVRTLQGKQCVLSFWAKGTVAGFVSSEVTQNFGAGGSATVVGIAATKHTLSTSWKRFSVPFTMPSLSGKVLGSSGDCVNVALWIDAGSSFNARTANLGNQSIGVSFSGIRLEEGTVATDDETPFLADELALCQRYYEKSYNLEVFPGTGDRVGSYRTGILNGFFFAAGTVPFAARKRSTPAVTIYAARDGTAGNGSEVNNSGVFVSNRVINSSNQGTSQFQTGGTNTMVAGSTMEFHWTADAEF